MAHHALQAFTIIGCIWFTHFTVRIGVTVWDVYTRWRRSKAGDPDAWKVDRDIDSNEPWLDSVQQKVSQLAFWSEIVTLVEACRESGEFPFEEPLAIDWEKAPTADVERLAGFTNPVDAIEQELRRLFVRSSVTEWMEVRRDKNRLYICSPSW